MKALKKRAKADLRNREFSIFLTNFATFQIRFRRQKSFSSVFTMRHNDKNCIYILHIKTLKIKTF